MILPSWKATSQTCQRRAKGSIAPQSSGKRRRACSQCMATSATYATTTGPGKPTSSYQHLTIRSRFSSRDPCSLRTGQGGGPTGPTILAPYAACAATPCGGIAPSAGPAPRWEAQEERRRSSRLGNGNSFFFFFFFFFFFWGGRGKGGEAVEGNCRRSR